MVSLGQFEEVPLTIKDFVFSPSHMDFRTLSDRQLRLMEYMCGNDVTKVFDNGRNFAVVCWGKGSGKDTVISMLFCYFVYWLLCLESPAAAFGLHQSDTIDIVNVAASREQATQVFFEMLKKRIMHWPWLCNRYKVAVSSVTPPMSKSDTVSIQKNLVVFPKGVRLFSGHTNLASLEGRNVLVWVLDEADGMKTENGDVADELYRLLRTSSVSRFGTRFKGFVITYPRSKDSFSIRLFKKHLDDLNVYTDKAATWEVKPTTCFSGKFFRFKDHLIPIEFKEDFDRDPFGSMTCYMCQPTEVESPFIEIPAKIDECATSVPLVLCEDTTDGLHVKKKIISQVRECPHSHIVGVDLGWRSDSACLSVVHCELRDGQPHYVHDLLLSWTPDYAKGEIVSFKNVAEVILELSKKIKILAVVFDRWNSVMIIEELTSRGIPSYDINLTFQDFAFLKEQIYQKRIELVPDSLFLEELKRLVVLRGSKVDHLPQYSKDRVDSLCCALRLFRDQKLVSKTESGWMSIDSSPDFIPVEQGGFTVQK
jgi:hypothetical protein